MAYIIISTKAYIQGKKINEANSLKRAIVFDKNKPTFQGTEAFFAIICRIKQVKNNQAIKLLFDAWSTYKISIVY